MRQRYGQRSVNGFAIGTQIVLIAGQTFKTDAIRLTPTGSVSGKVLDDSGRPAVGVAIAVLHSLYGQPGLKTIQQIGTGTTNNRGEYRIDNLMPDRYYVAAGNSPDSVGRRGASRQPSNISYAFSYFPGVNDVAHASLVNIRPGEDALANMTASRQKLYSVRGRVVDATGQTLSNSRQTQVSVSLNYSGLSGAQSYGTGRGYDPATGEFELLNVIPGSYVIQAHLPDVAPRPPVLPSNTSDVQTRQAALTALAELPIAELPIVVRDTDLENLVLTLTPPVTVPGKMTVDGAVTANVSSYDGVRLSFRRMSNGTQIDVGTSPAQQPVHADGTFKVAGMRAGEYLVALYVPSTYFVKSFRFDGRDILGKPLGFSGTIGVGFDIVLGSKPGQVSGTVTDAMLKPVPGIQAVVVPLGSEDKRTRVDLYQYFLTGQNGQFTISGIAPGYYNLFAWEGIGPFGYFDPDFLKTQEAKGKPIFVGESSVVTADIQVIPVTPE
jgi:protocatechuate 3,4-dioxygenase beta subunit